MIPAENLSGPRAPVQAPLYRRQSTSQHSRIKAAQGSQHNLCLELGTNLGLCPSTHAAVRTCTAVNTVCQHEGWLAGWWPKESVLAERQLQRSDETALTDGSRIWAERCRCLPLQRLLREGERTHRESDGGFLRSGQEPAMLRSQWLPPNVATYRYLPTCSPTG